MYCIFGIDKNLSVTPEIFVDLAIEEDKLVAKRVTEILQHNFHPFEENFRIHAAGIIKTVRAKASFYKAEKKQTQTIIGVCIDVTQQPKSNL